MLADGGNAFDAALAGLFVACIAEPVLCSLGGGGFLLAQSSAGANARGAVLYDFFCQTPGRRLPASELDFQPAPVNFGAASQAFRSAWARLPCRAWWRASLPCTAICAPCPWHG